MANDFMNWRISTSFRLLGIPHRKKRAVTRMKGRSWPVGNKPWPMAWLEAFCSTDVEPCIIRLRLLNRTWTKPCCTNFVSVHANHDLRVTSRTAAPCLAEPGKRPHPVVQHD